MKAIGKNIVIEKLSEKITTESGIRLSGQDSEEFRYQKGRVIVPGSDVETVGEGDVIYYDKSRSFTLPVEGKIVTIIQESAIIVSI